MSYNLLKKIQNKKYIKEGLMNIYGIGPSIALEICSSLGYSEKWLTNKLKEEDYIRITNLLKEYTISDELLRLRRNNIRQLIQLGTYRGTRHRLGLPVRGQRTHTNAKTASKRNK